MTFPSPQDVSALCEVHTEMDIVEEPTAILNGQSRGQNVPHSPWLMAGLFLHLTFMRDHNKVSPALDHVSE